MPSIFQIGTSLVGMDDLEDVLQSNGVPIEPDWSYRPFSIIVRLSNGKQSGNGFPVIRWRFNQLSQSHREILRETYCPAPALSQADIYINTPITETDSGALVWETFKCILNWPEEDEDFQADRTVGVVLIFTHCEIQ